MRRHLEHVAQRAVGFDQRVQRDGPLQARLGAQLVDGVRRVLQIIEVARLRDHEVRELGAGLGQQHFQHRHKRRVIERHHAGTDAAKGVQLGGGQLSDQMRVLDFTADGGTVLAIQRHIEHRAEFGLQLQALPHPHFHAAIVVTHRQLGHGVAFFNPHVLGVAQSGHGRGGGKGGSFRQEKSRGRDRGGIRLCSGHSTRTGRRFTPGGARRTVTRTITACAGRQRPRRSVP